MSAVPYTTVLSEADREYLGDRLAKSPKICQLLQIGRLVNDTRQLAVKLDSDPDITATDYEAATIDE